MYKYSFSSINEFAAIRSTVKQNLQEICHQTADHLFVALNEAVNNAIFHGNNHDTNKAVELTISKTSDEIQITIRDEGMGFNHRNALSSDALDDFTEHGRGLQIIEYYTDSIQYNEHGNEIVMRKKLRIPIPK